MYITKNERKMKTIIFDTDQETNERIVALLKNAIEEKGFEKAYSIAEGMLACALRRKHEVHIEFAKQVLEYYNKL